MGRFTVPIVSEPSVILVIYILHRDSERPEIRYEKGRCPAFLRRHRYHEARLVTIYIPSIDLEYPHIMQPFVANCMGLDGALNTSYGAYLVYRRSAAIFFTCLVHARYFVARWATAGPAGGLAIDPLARYRQTHGPT